MPQDTESPALINVWNRLEPRPRKEDFDRVLRAEVRDALWMLTRQWQFGEFKADDAGSAIFAKVDIETTRLEKISQRKRAAKVIDQNIPLETEVEQEKVPLDITLRLEMGRHWIKILTKALIDTGESSMTIDATLADFKNATGLQFNIPAQNLEEAAFFSNKTLWMITAAATGRTLDGGALYQFLKSATTNKASYFVSSGNSVDITIVNMAGELFIAWFERVYNQPTSEAESAWHPSHLEYQFACSAPNTDGTTTVLTADEYHHGRLDAYAFDYETDPAKYDSSLEIATPDPNLMTQEEFTVIPTEVIFGGMPNARWWEMEDRQIDLGDVNASTTDVAKILLAEFGLIYSNDWTLIPYMVPVGSLSEIKNIIITDVFGQQTLIGPAVTENNDELIWSMYHQTTRFEKNADKSLRPVDTRLFIPPVVDKMIESRPIEQVLFARDEMANMVFGIETIIPDDLGGGVDGFEAATKYTNYLKSKANPTPSTSAVENDAEIQYKIVKPIPENWIPFVPVRLGNSLMSRQIQLQRAAFPRIIDGLNPSRIRPRTELLRYGLVDPGMSSEQWQPYYIFEEEVPRSGAIVKRTWQRTRWSDGRVVTWLGRRKTNGRGEQSSGVRFDWLEGKDNDNL